MKIVICGSIQFTPEIKKTADALVNMGHQVVIPDGAERIINGEITLEKFMNNVEKGEGPKAKIKHDVIRKYYKKICDNDAILVLNFTKKNIENYIGGNTFLEMGFAYVLNKPIYLFNPIPQISYSDEIITMQPIVINQDLAKIIA
jgi:nucleoside 2-deoxyribosyltransferase